LSNDGNVTEKECKLVTDGIIKQLDRDETRLNDHSKSIDILTSISDRLTVIVEGQTKTLEEHSKRLLDLEKSKPWYDTEIGKYVIKAAILLLFLVVAAAVGLNALDTLKTVQSIK
jgi:hypothetical protein